MLPMGKMIRRLANLPIQSDANGQSVAEVYTALPSLSLIVNQDVVTDAMMEKMTWSMLDQQNRDYGSNRFDYIATRIYLVDDKGEFIAELEEKRLPNTRLRLYDPRTWGRGPLVGESVRDALIRLGDEAGRVRNIVVVQGRCNSEINNLRTITVYEGGDSSGLDWLRNERKQIERQALASYLSVLV